MANTILVTGATGWVGRSFIHELQLILSPKEFLQRVYLYGSQSTSIISTGYFDSFPIPVYELPEIIRHAFNKDVFVIHAAFLTKDKLKAYGFNAFVETNCKITNTISKAIKLASSARIIHISSGAAYLANERNEKSVEKSADPYGFLKLKEEYTLSAIAKTQTYRVYALTGRYIVYPRSFALGDFLLSALQNKRIHVRSNSPVIRGYVNASILAKCALTWLLSNEQPQRPLNTVTDIITLKSLAIKISKIFQLPTPLVEPFTQPPSSYSASPINFLNELQKYKIKSLDMHKQIIDTSEFLNVKI